MDASVDTDELLFKAEGTVSTARKHVEGIIHH
jgi:hypothetical protein